MQRTATQSEQNSPRYSCLKLRNVKNRSRLFSVRVNCSHKPCHVFNPKGPFYHVASHLKILPHRLLNCLTILTPHSLSRREMNTSFKRKIYQINYYLHHSPEGQQFENFHNKSIVIFSIRITKRI